MNPDFQKTSAMALVFCLGLALFGLPVRAQEEAVEDTGKPLGSFWVELQGWFSQPIGLNFSPATQNESILTVTENNELVTIFSSRVLTMDTGTAEELRYRFVWDLPRDNGRLAITSFTHDDLYSLSAFEPGNFVFVESLADAGANAGVNLDGLADAFISNAGTRLRDERLDYSRQAFRTSKVSADWSVGWRRVDHDRQISASYFAVLGDFPALIPPIVACPNGKCPVIQPSPDIVTQKSTFEGRGPTVGIDLEFPLWKNKVVFEAGVGLTALRGKVRASYEAVTRAFVLDLGDDAPVGFSGDPVILQPEDYDLFAQSFIGTGNQVKFFKDFIDETDIAYGVQSNDIDLSSDVLDTHVGLRWRAKKWLEVMLGFRNTRYNDVAVELRPRVAADFTNIQIQEINQAQRAVTHEGFYTGVIIRLY